MKALIDADIVAYRCSASCQQKEVVTDNVDVALQRVDELMHRIITETSATEHQAYLTGSNNFRFKYNPEYKANRKDKIKPTWLSACQEHLVLNWGAKVSDGNEADDELAIAQTKSSDTIICTIDKDLLQVPGKHYNFVKQEFRTISPYRGLQNFYWQLIMGDKSDNLFGFDGLARDKVPQKMYHMQDGFNECMSAYQMYEWVKEQYVNPDNVNMNAICMWLQREDDQLWQPPIENEE